MFREKDQYTSKKSRLRLMSSILTIARLRPHKSEKEGLRSAIKVEGKHLLIDCRPENKVFAMDQVFDSNASQEQVIKK